MRGVVAAGHPLTAEAGRLMLEEGGNAFDAVVGAFFAACVAEPVLASPGGGGYLMARTEDQKTEFYDFFVNTPQLKKETSDIEFFGIHGDFGESTQEFHVGLGSVAVPGLIHGISAMHRNLCTLPMKVLMEPAVQMARAGVVVNSFQAYVLDILTPIYTFTEESRKLYGHPERPNGLLGEGDIFKNPEFADFLETLGKEGLPFFTEGVFGHAVETYSRGHGGHLRQNDLRNYETRVTKPLKMDFKRAKLYLSPPSSSGGLLTGLSLKLMESVDWSGIEPFGMEHLQLLIACMELTDRGRLDALARGDDVFVSSLDPDFTHTYTKWMKGRASAIKGTTHFSVCDSKGQMASMTVSNGEGCGYIIPGTGIMLNNMLGEEDLAPFGFHNWKPGQRMTSMMCPSICEGDEGWTWAFGSGGSNRIRTALLQFILNKICLGMNLDEAINSPRCHFEKEFLNLESGFQGWAGLKDQITRAKVWEERNLFFGGLHCVGKNEGELRGCGDVRRGGVVGFSG